jgi:3-dehydroquinate synthase class II
MSASLALADDFKTNDGKEHKNVTVTRVEADGIVVRGKAGISKLYFTELPEDVQKRFRYDPEKAAAYGAQVTAAQQAAAQQAEELSKQQKQQQGQQAEQQGKQRNIQALENAYRALLDKEEELVAEIGRIENAQEAARRKWIQTGINDPHKQSYTDPEEANLPLLKSRLQNVRDEKERVRNELERAQRESR